MKWFWVPLVFVLVVIGYFAGAGVGFWSFGPERDLWSLDFNEDFTAFQIKDSISAPMKDARFDGEGLIYFNYRFYNIKDALLEHDQCMSVLGEEHVAGHCWTFGAKTYSGQCGSGEKCNVGNDIGGLYTCVRLAGCQGSSGWIYDGGCPNTVQVVNNHKEILACSYSLQDVVRDFVEDDESWALAYCDGVFVGVADVKPVNDLLGLNLGFSFKGVCLQDQTLRIDFAYIAHSSSVGDVDAAGASFALRPEGVSTSGSHTVAEPSDVEFPIAEHHIGDKTVKDILEEKYGLPVYVPNEQVRIVAGVDEGAVTGWWDRFVAWLKNLFM